MRKFSYGIVSSLSGAMIHVDTLKGIRHAFKVSRRYGQTLKAPMVTHTNGFTYHQYFSPKYMIVVAITSK